MAYRISTTKTWYETKSELETTFDKWGVRNFQVVGAPSGKRYAWNLTDAQRTVTVRFLHRSGNEVVLTMRAQPRPEDNLRVLYLGIESLRLNEARRDQRCRALRALAASRAANRAGSLRVARRAVRRAARGYRGELPGPVEAAAPGPRRIG